MSSITGLVRQIADNRSLFAVSTIRGLSTPEKRAEEKPLSSSVQRQRQRSSHSETSVVWTAIRWRRLCCQRCDILTICPKTERKIRPSIRPSIRPLVRPSIRSSDHPLVRVRGRPYIRTSAHPSARLFVCPSARSFLPSVRPSIRPSGPFVRPSVRRRRYRRGAVGGDLPRGATRVKTRFVAASAETMRTPNRAVVI